MHNRLPNSTITLKYVILIPTHHINSTLIAKVEMQVNILLLLLLMLQTLDLVEQSWLGTITFLRAKWFHLEDIFCLKDFFTLVLRNWVLKNEIFRHLYHSRIEPSVYYFNITLCFNIFFQTFFIWHFNQQKYAFLNKFTINIGFFS